MNDANEIDAFAPAYEPQEPPPIPWPDELPPQGIYPGIAFEKYRSWPAVNASVLKHGYYASPLHMRAAMDGVFGTGDTIVVAVQRHKVVRLIRQHGGCEVSVVWSLDGVPCKARLDKLIRPRRLVAAVPNRGSVQRLPQKEYVMPKDES